MRLEVEVAVIVELAHSRVAEAYVPKRGVNMYICVIYDVVYEIKVAVTYRIHVITARSGLTCLAVYPYSLIIEANRGRTSSI